MYSIYGLRLHASRPILGVVRTDEQFPDVNVTFEHLPAGVAELPPSSHELIYPNNKADGVDPPVLRAFAIDSGAYYLLEYCDNTRFVVSGDGSQIWATWPDELTFEDTCVYLLGPVFGFVLQLKGRTSLHASAVAVDGYAVALAGGAGAGKSTTAAMFARLGYSVISDDIVSLAPENSQFMVQPGYPLLRLWPSSAEILYGCSTALPQLTPTWDKLFLDLEDHGHGFEREPQPLGAIYLLEPRSDDPAAPYIEDVQPRDGLMALVANTYSYYLHDEARRARDFALLGRAAASVVLRKVIPNRSPDRLKRLCEVIVNDFRHVAGVRLPPVARDV